MCFVWPERIEFNRIHGTSWIRWCRDSCTTSGRFKSYCSGWSRIIVRARSILMTCSYASVVHVSYALLCTVLCCFCTFNRALCAFVISLYPRVFVVCCVCESLWDVKHLDLDKKPCVPTAFCNLVLTKQHTGLVRWLCHCDWVVGLVLLVRLFVWLGWVGYIGWRQKAPLGKTR